MERAGLSYWSDHTWNTEFFFFFKRKTGHVCSSAFVVRRAWVEAVVETPGANPTCSQLLVSWSLLRITH